MKNKCEWHKFVRLYYRKLRKGYSYQSWIAVKDWKICKYCLKIVKRKR